MIREDQRVEEARTAMPRRGNIRELLFYRSRIDPEPDLGLHLPQTELYSHDVTSCEINSQGRFRLKQRNGETFVFEDPCAFLIGRRQFQPSNQRLGRPRGAEQQPISFQIRLLYKI